MVGLRFARPTVGSHSVPFPTVNIKRNLAAVAVAVSVVVGMPLHAEAKTVTKKVCKTVKGKRTCRFVKVKVAAKTTASDTTLAAASDTTIKK